MEFISEFLGISSYFMKKLKDKSNLCQSHRYIVSNPLTCQLSFAAGFLPTNREHH